MTYKVRLIERTGDNEDGDAVYSAVVHYPVPNLMNSASVLWKDVLIYNKRNTTQLTVGASPTNITQLEKDAIVAGTQIEFAFTWTVGKSWTEPTRLANLQNVARAEIDKQWREITTKYQYYGFVEVYDD